MLQSLSLQLCGFQSRVISRSDTWFHLRALNGAAEDESLTDETVLGLIKYFKWSIYV